MKYHLIAGDLVAQLSLGGLQSGAKLSHIPSSVCSCVDREHCSSSE